VDGGRKELIRMLAIGLTAAVIGTALTLRMDWFPHIHAASTSADKIDTLYDWLLIASVPIFVLVMTVAIYSVVRFRARPGQELADGPPIHGHTQLEVIWVTIPFLIVTALAIYAAVVLAQVEKKQPNPLKVHVIGQQFTWHFEYENAAPGKKLKSDSLYLPKDRPVEFDINAADVLHSFWVPQFRLKQDAVPGITTHVRLTPTRVGQYEVVCAELCGLGHATMRVPVFVVAKAGFDKFVKQHTAPAKPAGGGGGGGEADKAALGKQIFTSEGGCGACHTLSDAGTSGKVGPNLDQIGKQGADFIRQSIVTPNKVITKGFPADTMPPDFQSRLGKDKIDALVQYLLKAGGGK
jgi:cytochrome c oxidase subunit 2